MSVSKFVIKCGNFTVLVDLQVLPMGSTQDSSRWTEKYKEQVGVLLREAVDERVRRFQEARHQKGPQKHRKELSPASPLIIKGEQLHLVAYFLKRHVNLRCVMRRQPGELRMFPERLVVYMSLLEHEEQLRGKENLVEMAESTQSKSKCFARPCESGEPLNSSAITKRNALPKIVQHRSEAPGHEDPGGEPVPVASTEDDTWFEQGVAEARVQGLSRAQREALLPFPERRGTAMLRGTLGPAPASPPSYESAPLRAVLSQGKGKRGRSSSQEDGEGAKRACPGRSPASPGEVIMKTHSAESLTQASAALPPLAPEPRFAVQSKLEGELLTRGKSGPKAPLAENNTEQADQTGLAVSAKGPTVRPSPPCSSASARASDRKEGEENVARKSRLRRVKKT
ncbi:protein SLX4IP [Arapaima gigas]